jgi:hypothetical protein
MLTRSLFHKYLVNARRLSIAVLFIGAALCHTVHAEINFITSTKLTDQVTTSGAPTLVYFKGVVTMYYVNNYNNTIYVDMGLDNDPISTGIVVNSTELEDVGAVNFNGVILISYVLPNTDLAFATSTDGINFSAPVTPSNASLGLTDTTPNWDEVPALCSFGSNVWVATEGVNGQVYISSTENGLTFSPEPTSVSTQYLAISRPSLAVYGNPAQLWVGYTTGYYSAGRVAIVGPAITDDIAWTTGNYYFGNNDHNDNFSGIELFTYPAGCTDPGTGCNLYFFAQSENQNEDLYSLNSNGGTTWGGLTFQGTTLRWASSVIYDPQSGYSYVAYQDGGDNFISYALFPD